ncbi:nicotinate (nicotinamide) nucleotide adenylyltransferase [Saccharospirillum impatiens]|uniref:nicotinate (nicotinamide) nucleotide adenylyltransferase n=1 Tax=Saccharospirillum impatiens TaxID=169438 RepID=UPI0003F6F4D8|nr:nicotinate (nicotinamide) nucleotide adenylyltransferase [Saccharospirillum impatiens]
MSDVQRPLMALFGGTFDPFHDGHAQLCDLVLSHQDVAQLRVIPCQIPALKAQAQATPEQRVAMLERWVASRSDGERLLIDDRELRRPGPSYTLDTVRDLHRDYPDSQTVFVLGADAFASMARWQGIDDLIRETHFWVFGRGSQVIDPPALPLTQVASLHDLNTEPAGLWLAGPSSEREWASRKLRDNSQHWQIALPKPIQDYIQQHGLYREIDE